ncbi:MAG: phosphoglucosamine mutase [Bacteroidota bacterium]
MPLMVSISGIRGVFGDGLDAQALVQYAGGFGAWCRQQTAHPTVVVGRDARVTGDVCSRLVIGALQAAGCHVVDAGLATTPTVEMAVAQIGAQGGIILSASHNPAQWNALKLLNGSGEFLSREQGETVLALSEDRAAQTVPFDKVGTYRSEDFLPAHIQAILDLPFIDAELIGSRQFRVAVDAVNSVGGIAVPALLNALGVEEIDCLNCEPTGLFAHNPEPLPQHLGDIMKRVKATQADLGVVVDPDADRLALVEDGGRFFGEELTQVLAADFLWRRRPGAFVTNLSSSRAIEHVAERHGQPVYRSAVGEVNVVELMKETNATLGGEGNGGVILPDLHLGRDALVGIAMTLQYLAERETSLSALRAEYPSLIITKNKLPLGDADPDAVLAGIAERYASDAEARISTVDGVKLDFDAGWVHLRKSNTEPILRVYAEAGTTDEADALAQRFMDELSQKAGTAPAN